MLGIVFTEFVEMVEEKFSIDMVDDILSDTKLSGTFTAVGNYDHKDLIKLVVSLSKRTEIDIDVLVKSFGTHLFNVFSTNYPQFFKDLDNTLDFLERIEDYIHVNVRKLYPQASLPKFKFDRKSNDTLNILYMSERAMGNLAEGLIMGCAEHYGEKLEISRTDNEDGTRVEFLIKIVK